MPDLTTQHRSETLPEDVLGFIDDAFDEFATGGNVVDKSLHHAGPEGAQSKISRAENFLAPCAGDEMAHVGEGCSGI